MGKIKNEDLGENKGSNKKLTAEELEQVKGGPVFAKYDGVDGESRAALNIKSAGAPTTLKKKTIR